MPIYEFQGITPVIEPGAYVHPTAVLIGDAFVLEGAYVAPYSVMRGDFGRLILGRGANLQDHCCMHGFPDTDTVVEDDGHIGHSAMLHGCLVKKNALVGINSTVLDNAIIGENAIVGAGALVTPRSEIPANHLAIGSPAKAVRELTDEEKKWKSLGTDQYKMLARVYPDGLKEAQAESKVDFERAKIDLSNYTHKPDH